MLLAAWPELLRLRALAIQPGLSADDPPLGDQAVFALAHCRHLARLTRLSLWNFAVSDRAAEALLDSPHLARVRVLRLYTHRGPGAPELSEAVRQRFFVQFGSAPL